MMTKTQTTAKKAPAKKAAAVKKAAAPAASTRTTVKAADVADKVFTAIKKLGGEDGVTLAQLSEATGIRGRVLSNVVWTLEGKPGSKTEIEARVKNVSPNRTKRFQVIG